MSYDIDPKLTGWLLAQEMARPGAPLNRLGELRGWDLAWVLARRPDAPLDRLGELHGYDFGLVMTHRADAPLDRLGELRGYDLAWVLARRPDAPLDRLGELCGYDLAHVLLLRPDAGGIQHPYIGKYQVWEWRDTLTIGCATHSITHWREHVEQIAAMHGEHKHVPAIRDLLNCISSADGGAS